MRYEFTVGPAEPESLLCQCCACGHPGIAQLSVDGTGQGFVCQECVDAAKQGGIAGWRGVLRRRIEKGRAGVLRAEQFADALPDDAEVTVKEHEAQ